MMFPRCEAFVLNEEVAYEKRWCFAFAVAVLAAVLCVDYALGQSIAGNAHSDASFERPFEGTYVSLQVDGGYLRLLIPTGYQLQAYELSDVEDYPFSYVFLNDETHSQFIVYSSLDNEKNQAIGLRKLYDPGNHFVLYEDVRIGQLPYTVYTKEQAAYDYGFLLCTENGYSYQFQYTLPYDRPQNTIPAEAISILSTLAILESSV